jgi:hypothetical protein
MKRKATSGEAGFDEELKKILQRIDDKFFRQLEKEGKRPWPQPARDRLIYILKNYSIGALLPTTAGHESDVKNRERVRKAAGRLRDALAAFPASEQAIFAIRLNYAQVPTGKVVDDVLMGGLVDLATIQPEVDRMISGLENLSKLPAYGVPTKIILDFLLHEIARIYDFVGGKVAVSRGGPFGRVLEIIYDVMPKIDEQMFPSSSNAFVVYAGNQRHRLKQRVRQRPLEFKDLPKI